MFQTVIIALNEGFLKTFEIFCVTLLGALPLGLIIAFGSMSRWRPLKWFVKTLVWVVRGTPLMLQLLIIFLSEFCRQLVFFCHSLLILLLVRC